MASYVDMSLDDIIRKKKKENPRKPGRAPMQIKGSQIQQKQRPIPVQKLAVIDARNMIISKKRTQISDARDKLAELSKQKDARLKLEKLRLERLGRNPQELRGLIKNRGKLVQNTERMFVDSSRQVAYQPITINKNVKRQMNAKKFVESRTIGSRLLHKTSKPTPIVRTVENDIEIVDDPMEDEYAPSKSSLLNRKASLQLKIIAHNDDAYDNRNRLSRTAVVEGPRSPPRPPSILKKRPMAALRSEKMMEKEKPATSEFRIIVSNLRNSVTGSDIDELFGDVGGMLESRLVRPGTAEVLYKSQEDAKKAVELYHNRQLDGQPMNCLLVAPRSPTALPARSGTGLKPALYSTNSNVEPDISTFHKVLFSNL